MTRTVLVDIDGVLADFAQGYSDVANRLYGTPLLTTLTCPRWSVGDSLGLTKEQDEAVWDVIKWPPNFWGNLAPLCSPHELELLQCMEGLVIATHREGYTTEVTRLWLDRLGLQHAPCIHVVDKSPLLGAFEGGWAVDDHSGTIARMEAHLKGGRSPVRWSPYVLDRPYNRLASWLPRVYSLEEFLDLAQSG